MMTLTQRCNRPSLMLFIIQRSQSPISTPRPCQEVREVGVSRAERPHQQRGIFDWSLSDLQSHTKENMMKHSGYQLSGTSSLTKVPCAEYYKPANLLNC